MSSTSLSDVVVGPQDPGTGIGSKDDPNSAALVALIGSHEQGSYVPGDGGLTFTVDTGTNTLDVSGGYCYVLDDVSVTNSNRDGGGRPHVQSSLSVDAYDTELPDDAVQSEPVYVVIVPSAVTGLSLDSGVNDVYISIDPTQQNSSTLHYGNGITAPTDPSLFLGTVDAGDGSITRPNDRPDHVVQSFESLSVSRSDDGVFSGKTLESGESVTVESDESFVVSDEYTVNGTLTVDGSMTVI